MRSSAQRRIDSSAALKRGGRIDALFCDVFPFRDDKICRPVTYQVDRLPGDQTRRAFDA
jgi:hypothetical protein